MQTIKCLIVQTKDYLNGMMKISVFLGLWAVVSGAAVPPKGQTRVEEYIVGGKPTPIEEVPYQIALLSKKQDFICGGSIISDTHVVTAAHCIDIVHPNYLQYNIRAGSSDKAKGGQIIASKKVIVHSKYNATTMDYDVAIIELVSAIQFSRTSKPIKISDREPADGELVKASGWGCLTENGTRPVQLHSVTVATVNRRTCEKNHERHYRITNRMICAAATGKDACQGDGGGPLAYKGTLIGVVSFGVGCAREDFPGVYASLADTEVRKFIKENAKV